MDFIYDYYNHSVQRTKNPPILSIQQCRDLLLIKYILPYRNTWEEGWEGPWSVGFLYPEKHHFHDDLKGVYFNVYQTSSFFERD